MKFEDLDFEDRRRLKAELRNEPKNDQEIIRRAMSIIGRSRSERKLAAQRRNAQHAGRPRMYPQCPKYKAHYFSNDRCPCGYKRAPTFKEPAYRDKYKRRIKGLAAVPKPIEVKPPNSAEEERAKHASLLPGEWVRIGNQLIFRR